MKNGQVTPAFVHPVIPVLYVDLPVEVTDGGTDEAVFQDGLSKYPSLQFIRLINVGPDGHPVYRVEGPLPVIIDWAVKAAIVADEEQLLDLLRQARLAS